jgi:hypothetical protein
MGIEEGNGEGKVVKRLGRRSIRETAITAIPLPRLSRIINESIAAVEKTGIKPQQAYLLRQLQVEIMSRASDTEQPK